MRRPDASPSPATARQVADLGEAFGHFLVWAARRARRLGAARIFFLSREGHWLARHYEALRRRDPDGASFPPARHLAVSRLSTFLPSLPALDDTALRPLLAQYGEASVQAVLTSLGFFLDAPPVLRARLAARGLLERPWAAASAEVWADRQVRAVLQARRHTQRRALRAYLRQAGIADDAGEVVVADIGWRGSIQDNLARLLPRLRFTGLYFHLQPPFTAAPATCVKHAFIDGRPADARRLARRLRFAAPLEFAASDVREPTAWGYAARNDAVEVRQAPIPHLPPATQAAFAAFQHTLEAGLERVSLGTSPDAEAALRAALRFIEHPAQDVIDLFFRLPRDDTFGAAQVVQGAQRIGYGEMAAALFDRRQRLALGRKLAASHWPWALLARDVPVLAPWLRRVILWRDFQLPTPHRRPG